MKNLEQVLATIEREWPSVPVADLDAVAAGAGGKPEEALQRVVAAVLRRLRHVGIVAWFTAVPNEAMRARWTYWELQGVEEGTPDLIVALPRGRVVWLEAKSARGRLRDRQRAARAALQAGGHRHYVPRSAGEAVAIIAEEWKNVEGFAGVTGSVPR